MKLAPIVCMVGVLYTAAWSSGQDYGTTGWVLGVAAVIVLFATACITALLLVRRQPPPDAAHDSYEDRFERESVLISFRKDDKA